MVILICIDCGGLEAGFNLIVHHKGNTKFIEELYSNIFSVYLMLSLCLGYNMLTFTLEQEEAYLKQKEESDRDAALLAEVDGKVVGTAGVDSLNAAEKTRHRAHFGISIAKAWWGLGIGRALTEACIECAREAGYLQLELEVVADNIRATELYKSVGFTEYGRNPKSFRSRNSGWQENVLMRLEL